MPCNNLAIQRAKLVPKILDELVKSEGARATFKAFVEGLIPGVQFRVSMPEIARTHSGRIVKADWLYLTSITGKVLRVWVQAEGLTVSGDDPTIVQKLQSELEKNLPKLAAMFAGQRGRKAVEQKFPGTVTERVGAGVYRQKLKLRY